jgi:hypothetical protein
MHPQYDRHDLEGIARELLDASGLDDPPVSPLWLARHLGLVPIPSSRTAIAGPVLLFDDRLPERRRRIRVAHELGHALLRRAGLDDRDERAAWHVGAALVVPGVRLRRDLSRHAWDLRPLVDRYDVSWEVLARRLTSAVSSVVSVWDNGELTRRWSSPWLQTCALRRRGTPGWEAELAGECRALERDVTPENLVAAYHVPSDEGWGVRVVVVSAADEWEARTLRLNPRLGCRCCAPRQAMWLADAAE